MRGSHGKAKNNYKTKDSKKKEYRNSQKNEEV